MLDYNSVKCHFCAAVAKLLDNPYQYSGQVVAKLSVNFATIIWVIVVLAKPSALLSWPGSVFAGNAYLEDALAALLLALCPISLIRLFNHSRPLTLGACVYGLYLLLWLYTWSTLIVAVATGVIPPRPGQLAGVTVVTALAVFAFVSNPKRKRDGSPSA